MMEPTLLHLPEPTLTFGYNQDMEHPKDGLFLFGPLEDKKPAEVRFGAIGTAEGLARLRRWLSTVRNYIPAYDPTKPFHSSFPGFQAAFRTLWPAEAVAEIAISGQKIAQALRLSNRHDSIFQTVDIFAEKLCAFRRQEETDPDFWFVVIPEEVFKYGRPKV